MNHASRVKMDAEHFFAWASKQDEGRFELVDGEIRMMSPERIIHNRVKFYIARALDDALFKAGIDGAVYTDGIGIKTSKERVCVPDASIQLGPIADVDKLNLDKPYLVVEVRSPSTGVNDESGKLAEYASVQSIQHYLIVDPDKRSVVHYRRLSKNEFAASILTSSVIRIDPPGFEFNTNDFYAVNRTEGGA
jgi:Uma2 family endonuclease